MQRLVYGVAFSWRRTWLILVFGETLQICCFNWFAICTYCCELFRASLSKNSSYYSFTVPEDASHDFNWRSPLWIFSSIATDDDDCDDDDAIPLIAFSLVVVVMKPGFITGNSWQKSISAVPAELAKFCTGIFPGFFFGGWGGGQWIFSAPILCRLFCSQVCWWWPYLPLCQSWLWHTVHLYCSSKHQLAHQSCFWSLSSLLWLVCHCRPCLHCPFHRF